jgi:uncharacterized protein
MEGDPLCPEGGLEYLFGCVTLTGRDPRYTEIWGRDRAEERDALERFIDFVTERRERYSDLHVYHYNHYEVSALKRLAGAHGTREDELDSLLRSEVFVDLYKVVREGLRISQPSYSMKKVEALYMEPRDTSVTEAGDSVIMFERWLTTGDASLLADIAAYNRDDCISTLRLRDWLLDRRAEAEWKFEGRRGAIKLRWFEPREQKRSDDAIALREENQALVSELLDGIPLDEEPQDPDAWDRLLMARLLEYHDREERPAWWTFFDRMRADAVELSEDADCIARIEADDEIPARVEQESLVHTLRFPPQETKLRVGSDVADVADGGSPGSIVALKPERGWLELKRGSRLDERRFPEALMPGRPYRTTEQKGALRRLAVSLLDGGEAYPAACRILRCQPPLLRGREPGSEIDHWDLCFEELLEIVASLDASHLFIQGPPGSGKTWSGARLIVELVERGNRVGVTGNSHKVIHNMLHQVEEVAHERGSSFVALQKCSTKKPESEFDSKYGLIEPVEDNCLLNDPQVSLTAGTAWHYCREDTAPLDYLFIDEAGQVALADALALATSSRNVVLLGDPQQLPQVAQGAHPQGSSLSVLEHLLGDEQTVSRTHGIFLDETYRLHPDVCGYVSELMYDNRLSSAPGRERQRIDAEGELSGTGLRWLAVTHAGHSQSSPEEADRIASAIEPLLETGSLTDAEGRRRPLAPEDILVVAPYNAQVNCLEDRLPDGIRIGTVDKLQGQQAEIVFFSMATSSDEEVPRNIEFLFSRNRLNVAISRARCLAVLVCCPRLLDIRPTSIEQMRLVNALCRFTEIVEAA